ncbi:MAG: hypothetical protein NC427_06085 [Ruminococcus flavefaciens]|nr:hypothetical protein [Ruminococcus flavefaciens]
MDNQPFEATACDGKTTKKICYTYDGDGNRVYQLNYNPEKDEDFSDYYCSYKNCDYNGTGIQLQAGGEVSQAEKDLIALIKASGAVGNSQYELIEYLNDVNRELQAELEHYDASFGAGIFDSLLSHVGSIGIGIYNTAAVLGDIYRETEIQRYNSGLGKIFGEIEFEPMPLIATDAVDTYLEERAAEVWDIGFYYAGRCGGDVGIILVEAGAFLKGITGAYGELKGIYDAIKSSSAISGGEVFAIAGGGSISTGRVINLEVVVTAVLEGVAEGVIEGTAAAPALMGFHTLKDYQNSISKINVDGALGSRCTYHCKSHPQ